MRNAETAVHKAQPSERLWWQRYGVAIGAVFVGWIFREAITAFVGPTALPFIFFFPAVAVVSWYGGLWPGVLSAVAAAGVANWFFFDSTSASVHRVPYEVVATLSFLLSSSFIIAAIEMMHRTSAKLIRETVERRHAESVRAQAQELLATTLASLSVSPLKDSDGNVIGASRIIHDISDIIAAQEDLVREREMLATTLRSIGDGVIVTDAGGVVTFVNPEAERLTGWSQTEAAGVPLAEMFHIVNEETRKEVENPVQEVLRSGRVVGLANHTLLLAKDGTERPIDDSAAPILHSDGRIFGVVLVFRDFTERRAAEQALRNSEAALQDELRRKNEFLAILSHELRNPLAPIRSAVGLLKRLGPPLPELQELRDIVDRQTTQLTRLLDDLLDVSRISSGKIALRKEVVDLSAAIASATESVRPLMESRGQELAVQLADEPIHVLGDATRLAQVFANLLSNASKYTESGGRVTLTADCNGGEAAVCVSDPGIGISPDQIRRIFEMFAQVEQPSGKEQSGLGIGLALAQKLVEMHAGTIDARSAGLGHGSEFTVRLPVLSPQESVEVRPPDNEAQAVSVKGLRILLADDNVDSALTMAMILRIAGHDVRVAHDGFAAVEAVKSFSPDIAILDIGMPMMDGYIAARKIRQSVASPIKLIAVTGWGQESDKRRAKEAGFDHHLTKPVDFPVLEQLIGGFDGAAERCE